MVESGSTSRKHIAVKVSLVLILLSSSPCWANLPFAGQHYPNGAEDFVVGALPPPGSYLKTYFALFQKDRLMDEDGKNTGLDFEADVTTVVPRFIWVSPWKILGASYATQAFFPLHWTTVNSGALGIDQERASGLGDIIFTPIALGWHFGPTLHVVVGEDLVLPTGDYDADNPASQILSKNHWTFESVAAISYLAGGFDFSAKLMYDFNTKNDDYNLIGLGKGELDPGQEFHVDWALSYAGSEGLRYGISGYSYWQITKDEFDADAPGVPTIKGDKGVVHALGPTIKYWPNQGRFSAVLKHQWELGAQSLPEGQTTWLNVVWVF